ncbi:MAG TPA: hypothetical protein VK982_02600 [Bacteroidales bacterium]|nr:hypothetical protein [Bacteroidales bacterium]
MSKALNSFVVEIPNYTTDPNLYYKKELLKLIANKYPNFTVSGKDRPVIRRGVEHASYNNLLTFGTSSTHDVEWIERRTYACEKGYVPVYNLTKDWDKIQNRLAKLYDELYPETYKTDRGYEVEFFKNFVKIGYKRVSYEDFRFKFVIGQVILTKDDIEALYFSMF